MKVLHQNRYMVNLKGFLCLRINPDLSRNPRLIIWTNGCLVGLKPSVTYTPDDDALCCVFMNPNIVGTAQHTTTQFVGPVWNTALVNSQHCSVQQRRARARKELRK